jgi:hypothetical protein
MSNTSTTEGLKTLGDKWPSSFVARQEAKRFSGGIISEKSLANLDSKGEGPKGRFRIGKKIAYPVESLIAWLEGRATRLN